MSVLSHVIRYSTTQAAIARDNITTIYDGRHHAKVCCICDRLIMVGEEDFVSFEVLKKKETVAALKKDNIFDVPLEAQRIIHNYYTPICVTAGTNEYTIVRKLYLSPRSYPRTRPKYDGLGCCVNCKRSIDGLSKQKNSLTPKPPAYAISNGLMFGPVPDVLKCLNSTELALISIARVDKHVFSFQGGAHMQMKGWHSMYANDIDSVNRTINWCADHLDDDLSYSDEENNEEPEQQPPVRKRFANICVILSGPFTREQYSIVREKTKVDCDRVRAALRWLKNNNRLYKDFDLNDEIVQPIFLEQIQEVASQNSNVERTLDFCAIFPDGTFPDSQNGGFNTRKGFKEVTLQRMLLEAKDRDTKLISKPTTNILRDYEGDNLLKAFPLQFPYGIGSRKKNDYDKFHNGIEFYRHLSYISRSTFQRPDFICVLHNMFERTAMRFSATFRRRTNDINNYASIKNEDIQKAAERFFNGSHGSTVADNFFRAITASTKEMAHTNAAAKEARQQLYAMCGRFGVPSMMVTITPDDEFNFRIRVYSNELGESNPPPASASNKTIREYLLRNSELRKECPGYCAIDYENVMAIFVRNFLGWDEIKHSNIPTMGIFGNVEAWSIATEEQGRKTLHGHCLVWLKDWPELNDKLMSSDAKIRKKAVPKLIDFSKLIMSTHVMAKDDLYFKRPCDMECTKYGCIGICNNMLHCTSQDVRNLRCLIGTTTLGGRAIMKCEHCNRVYTSEDLAIAKVIDWFGQQHIYDNGIRPSSTSGFWTRNLSLSNSFLRMERQIMESLLPKFGGRPATQFYSLDEKTRGSIAITKNLHMSSHTKKCFKSGGSPECRMKMPNKTCGTTTVQFEDKPTKWYAWNGLRRERHMFLLEPKRSAADLFGNVYSAPISEVFGCNTNVAACVDGGSPLYLTNYTTKNTQDEDSATVISAAKQIIKSMIQSIETHGRLFGDNLDETISELTDEQKKQRGLRALMAAVMQSTRAHMCSATMGAYLIRNKSRFKFSHEFVYVNLFMFEKEEGMDYTLASNHNGTTFFRSSVADYCYRPLILENVCLYDFLANYCVSSPCKESYDWYGDHPTKDFRKVKKRKYPVVPRLNHFDFPNSSEFGDLDIRICSITGDKTAAHFVMESYSKKVCILFVPFRKMIEDLTINDSFHQKLQKVYLEGRLTDEHEKILQNLQDVRNSLNAGRVRDPLEKCTQFQYSSELGAHGMTQNQTDTTDLMDDLMSHDASYENICLPKYRSADDKFSYSTMTMRELGRNKCGTIDLVTPFVEQNKACIRFVNENSSDDHTEDVDMDVGNKVWPSALHSLTLRTNERISDIDDNGCEKNVPKPNGTLQNLVDYSEALFGEDLEQRHSFVTATAAFCLRLHVEAGKERNDLPRANATALESTRKKLANVLRSDQLIAFLNGPGGTGKSHVVSAIVRYCKKLCESLQINFDKRTVVVTAMSGSAAVSIRGETTHMACCTNYRGPIKQSEIDRWRHAYLLIIDEISFASKTFIETLNISLGTLLQNVDTKFGGIHILFVGDMSQLDPVGQRAMYREEEVHIFTEWVDTFFELKTNHRFKNDLNWGKILGRFRDAGPKTEDVNTMNTRVIGSNGGPTLKDIPVDVTYATVSNDDRVAINDGIFYQHLKNTHSNNPTIDPPKHTICIKASGLKWSSKSKNNGPLNDMLKDIFYACCGEAHLFTGTTKKGANGRLTASRQKMYSPMLKLYYDRPMMMTDNLDVEKGLANGSMCNFKEVVLMEGVTFENLERILIDGYYVWCADVSQVRELKVELQEADKREVTLKPEKISATCEFPVPVYGKVDRNTERYFRNISLKQFRLNEANARTVHKLQGKSLPNVVINSFKDYGHWGYVALSRVKTMKGLFLRTPVDYSKCTGMDTQVRRFMDKMKQFKTDMNYLHS